MVVICIVLSFPYSETDLEYYLKTFQLPHFLLTSEKYFFSMLLIYFKKNKDLID